MPTIKEQFGTEVRKRLDEKGWSFRRAKIGTGLDHYTIGEMSHGVVPSRGKVIQWAQAIGENINWWLELAGYEPIPMELLEVPPPGKNKYYFEVEDMVVSIQYTGEFDRAMIPAVMPAVRKLKAAIDREIEKEEAEK